MKNLFDAFTKYEKQIINDAPGVPKAIIESVLASLKIVADSYEREGKSIEAIEVFELEKKLRTQYFPDTVKEKNEDLTETKKEND